MAVWWLHQASFVVKTPDGKIAIIDPYLTDACGPTSLEMGFDMRRMHPTCLEPEDVAGVDVYVMTHSHGDHLDPETIKGYREAGGQGPYLAPQKACEELIALGIPEDQIVRTWPGHSFTIGDLTFAATFAIPFGGDDLTHVGFVVSASDGPTFYFTGDTAYHEVIGITVAEHKPDVMFSVINGTFRNLSPSDAAMLAHQIQPKVVIPYHHNLFPDGQMPPQTLRMNLMLYDMSDRFHTLTPGEPWVFTCPGD